MGTIADLSKQLTGMETRLSGEINEQKTEITKISKQLDNIENKILPNLQKEIDDLKEDMNDRTEIAALKAISADVYSRKTSIILYGLPGTEHKKQTRKNVLKVAEYLHLQKPALTATHRLGRDNGAPIIVKFQDLDDKDDWISNSKKLKDYRLDNETVKLSLSPCLPPILGRLKQSVFDKRNDIRGAKVQYADKYPFVYGVKPNGDRFYPDVSTKDLAIAFYKKS